MAGWIHGLKRSPCATCGHRPLAHILGNKLCIFRDGCKLYVR